MRGPEAESSGLMMRSSVLSTHTLAVLLSRLLISVWPSQLKDFQTWHQPKLLSGLLEQNGFTVAEVPQLAQSFLPAIISDPCVVCNLVTDLS